VLAESEPRVVQRAADHSPDFTLGEIATAWAATRLPTSTMSTGSTSSSPSIATKNGCGGPDDDQRDEPADPTDEECAGQRIDVRLFALHVASTPEQGRTKCGENPCVEPVLAVRRRIRRAAADDRLGAHSQVHQRNSDRNHAERDEEALKRPPKAHEHSLLRVVVDRKIASDTPNMPKLPISWGFSYVKHHRLPDSA
jgi:hypothetical protein